MLGPPIWWQTCRQLLTGVRQESHKVCWCGRGQRNNFLKHRRIYFYPKMSTFNMFILFYLFILFYFITFHFISLHFTSLHFILFHFISLHFTSLYFIILFYFIYFFYFISFHFTSLYFILFHFTSLYFILFYFILFYFKLTILRVWTGEQRERETENPKQASCYQCRAQHGAWSHEPWDRDLSRNQVSDI